MRSSVATEDCSRILTASIGGGAVSRLLFRQIISKFQSDNLTAELERAYRASAFSHRETGSWLWVSRFSVWYAYRYSPITHYCGSLYAGDSLMVRWHDEDQYVNRGPQSTLPACIFLWSLVNWNLVNVIYTSIISKWQSQRSHFNIVLKIVYLLSSQGLSPH